MPGGSVQTSSYSPASGAVNVTVSEAPGCTIVAVATLIGSPRVKLCGTVVDRFSKVSATSASAGTVTSAGSKSKALPVSVPTVISTTSDETPSVGVGSRGVGLGAPTLPAGPIR